MTCQRGFVDAFFTLAPTLPPRLQYLAFTQAAALSETMKTKATDVAALFDDPLQDPLARMFATSLDMAALGRNRAAVRQMYGSCRVGETLAGDGKTSATVRLECDRGPLDVALRLDGDGRLSEVVFHSPPDAVCAP